MASQNFQKIEFEATEPFHGQRIDKVLSTVKNIGSRSRATKLIEQGLVQFADTEQPVEKPSMKVSLGDKFFIIIPETSDDSEIIPMKIDLDIVYEDEHLVVINKPSGLVVHPAAGHENDTLVNALVFHFEDLSMGFGERRPGIVHRLDKDTSGLLVVAKNDLVHGHLTNQFKRKTVHRIYKALVFGTPKQKEGTVESYLIRNPNDRKKMSSEKFHPESTPKGKIAITHYKVLEEYPCGITQIQCQLETGRTHQIRVHMSDLHHPLVADPIYSTSGRAKNLKSAKLRGLIKDLNRVALHAEQLGFMHPIKKERLSFSKPWPENMHGILREIGAKIESK